MDWDTKTFSLREPYLKFFTLYYISRTLSEDPNMEWDTDWDTNNEVMMDLRWLV